MTRSITTTEFMRDFGRYHDEARIEPITLTKYGRPSVVVVPADLYARMSNNADPRRSYLSNETPPELAEMILSVIDDRLEEDDQGPVDDKPLR
ncbi:prevent-host-death family protein [Neorhizobium huautlense]|uniref:Antitoxin n=1 Tax=Neorhizobium huautlense TaxID=67774 RepID=A0ABT9PZZ4_9HYPH|nr:prevent-host-death family protein [Neorhizobium huautlense]